jgi:predicted DsbA family dithiol-disulfide isomerase
VEAVAWSDYICPWAYLGRDRTRVLVDLGVAVTTLPFELHTEIPAGGRPNRRGGRLDHVFDVVEAECVEIGVPFRRPERTPSSRRALETAEVVRRLAPGAWVALDESLARAHWVDGHDIADPEVVDHLVADAGVDPVEARELVADGVGTTALRASMDRARELGVTATPAWWVGDALLIPGAQPRETMRRWVRRLLERAETPETRDA